MWFAVGFHTECFHKYPGSLPYQVGVCATGVQSWAKEYCKHSDGQGIARMPQFRCDGSHFYLKHGYICLEKDKPLSAKMSFLAVFQTLHCREVSVILLQRRCWGFLWIIPVTFWPLTPERPWVGVCVLGSVVHGLFPAFLVKHLGWLFSEPDKKFAKVWSWRKTQGFAVREFSGKRMGFSMSRWSIAGHRRLLLVACPHGFTTSQAVLNNMPWQQLQSVMIRGSCTINVWSCFVIILTSLRKGR